MRTLASGAEKAIQEIDSKNKFTGNFLEISFTT
jgi:hypothetical protein